VYRRFWWMAHSYIVEDLDLSYPAQMKGWKCVLYRDIVVNAELPVTDECSKRDSNLGGQKGLSMCNKVTWRCCNKAVQSIQRLKLLFSLQDHIVHRISAYISNLHTTCSNDKPLCDKWIAAFYHNAYLAVGPVAIRNDNT